MMNAEQVSDTQAPLAVPGPAPDPVSAFSALVDGEIEAAELNALLLAFDEQADACSSWHCYQLIGEALRGATPLVCAVSPQAFLAGIQTRLRAEPLAQARPEIGASVAHVRAPAANDAVFRWKWVAGVASLAAVMAVSWSVLRGAPSGHSGTAVGPQLALTQPAAAPVALAAAPTAVLVHTAQGLVIRDARLEELLLAHRQHGGMSALQMPAGFLRDATFDAAPQR